MSIAQSVIEFIHHNPRVAAKTLFATHYHELTALERRLPRVGNLTSAVAETEQGVVFLHRMLPGGADRSYGLHVARLAGLPEPLVQRAAEILADLERSVPEPRSKRRREPAAQLPLLAEVDGVAEALRQMDLDTLTPIQALTALYDLKQRVRGS
jgi:DNA mismatch repair protein MutS